MHAGKDTGPSESHEVQLQACFWKVGGKRTPRCKLTETRSELCRENRARDGFRDNGAENLQPHPLCRGAELLGAGCGGSGSYPKNTRHKVETHPGITWCYYIIIEQLCIKEVLY